MFDQEEVAAHLRPLTIICFAIMAVVVIFAGVVWYLTTSGAFTAESTGSIPFLGSLLNLFALSMLVIAHYIPVLLKAPGPDASEDAVFAWHKNSTIVAFAMREGGAFLALVGALLTGRLGPGFAVAGLAIVAMVLAWPRAGQLES